MNIKTRQKYFWFFIYAIVIVTSVFGLITHTFYAISYGELIFMLPVGQDGTELIIKGIGAWILNACLAFITLLFVYLMQRLNQTKTA